jgi:cell division septum initiation protein DivIVA
MLGLDKQLANAKNDAERVKILTQIAEIQKQRIEELDNENTDLKEENAKLKEQIKEHEDLENILDSGSSVSSAEGIDTKIDQNIKDLESLLLNSKKSTATIRKEIKLLKRIKKLKFLN